MVFCWPSNGARPRLGRPHIILLWTDQERHPQHWPEGWVEANLPSSNRLKRHGLSFVNAFTAAAQCTPSRATFLTSTYPTVNGVTNTLVYPLQSLQQNLAIIMGAAGYEVAYKGKWHLSLPVQLGAPGTFDRRPPRGRSKTSSTWPQPMGPPSGICPIRRSERTGPAAPGC